MREKKPLQLRITSYTEVVRNCVVFLNFSRDSPSHSPAFLPAARKNSARAWVALPCAAEQRPGKSVPTLLCRAGTTPLAHVPASKRKGGLRAAR